MKKMCFLMGILFFVSVSMVFSDWYRVGGMYINNIDCTRNYSRDVEYNVERSGRIGVWFTHSASTLLIDGFYFTPSFGNNYSAELRLMDEKINLLTYYGTAKRQQITNRSIQWDVEFVANGQRNLIQFLIDQ